MLSNFVIVLTGICFILAFNFFFDFVVDDDNGYLPFILWNAVLHVILFVANLYIFLKLDGDVLNIFIGTATGYLFARYYKKWMQKGNFTFINFLNLCFLCLTILLAFLSFV